MSLSPLTAQSTVSRGPFLSWPQIVALLSLLTLFRADDQLSDPDTYWHVAAGRWIIANGRVPQTDPFSHSMAGTPWTPHEWLAEVVMALLHQAGGWPALVVVSVLCWGLALALLTRFLLTRLEPIHALLFTALAVAMTTMHLLARPHVLVMPILVTWVAALVNCTEQRSSPPWWLIGIIVLWANLHGSFTLGLVLAAAFAVEATFEAEKGSRVRAAKTWGTFVILCTAGSMLTPSGWHTLWFTVQVMRMEVALAGIEEWQSTNFQSLHGHSLEVWLLIVLGIALSGRLRLPWARVLLMLGLTHLALKHVRNIPVLGLISPILIATPLARAWYAMPRHGADAARLDQWFRSLVGPARLTGSLLVAGLIAVVLVVAVQRATIRPLESRTPAAALDAARKAGAVSTPVFNAYIFGGYLIYQGIPVYVDGRADMYGDAFLRELAEVQLSNSSDALVKHLQKYRIGWTLLEPGNPNTAQLDNLPGWRRLYADDVAVVHVRDTPHTPSAR